MLENPLGCACKVSRWLFLEILEVDVASKSLCLEILEVAVSFKDSRSLCA